MEDDGIRLALAAPPIGGGRNIVRRNVVVRAAGDGFRVFAKDGHSLLRRNVAIDAADDGFEVESRSTELTANRAIRNGDLGIDAIRGVVDEGRNVARRNGDARQCIGVACS